MIFRIDYLPFNPEIKSINIAAFFFTREIKISLTIFNLLVAEGGLIILKCIWPEVKPNETQCVWRIIDVFNFFKRVKSVSGVIQRNVDNIIHLLLPISGVLSLREDAIMYKEVDGKQGN